MPNKVYRTAIYTRLSREDGDKDESNSIKMQRALLHHFVETHFDQYRLMEFQDV